MKDAFIGISLLVGYFVLYYFWALSFGQKYSTIAVILGIFPWIYMVIVMNDGKAFKSIFNALFWSTILVLIAIVIFGK
jgi:hypothetical protein